MVTGYFVGGWCEECEFSHEFGPYRTWNEMNDDYKERNRSHTMDEAHWTAELPHDTEFFIPRHITGGSARWTRMI